MSWITPIKNTFIKFIVKGNGSGGGSGGIDEETLNAKLAQFYATTETKILNLVNQKLADYVLLTAFNELEAKVNTNTTNIVTNTTNISTNTTDINTLKQKVASLEATPIGGSYLELVNLEIPVKILQSQPTGGIAWEDIWTGKELYVSLWATPENGVYGTIVDFLKEKIIISIIDASFDSGSKLANNNFTTQRIISSTLLGINVCMFQGVIDFGAYSESNPYKPKDSDFLYLSLMVSNKPKSTTQSTQNGVKITRGGV